MHNFTLKFFVCLHLCDSFQEQTNERDQEHEDYQKELDKWKKIVQDIDKHNGAESRLQREVRNISLEFDSCQKSNV